MATDLSDPVVLLTIAQTVILVMTMVVFILSFRSQNLAIKEAAYQGVLNDYSDSISLILDKPELGTLVEEMSLRGDPEHPQRETLISKENRVVFGYMLLNYSLFERVYLLYARKWIDEETWNQWYVWMKGMAKHPMFQEVHHRSHGTFDTKFQALVEEAMKDKS